MGMSREVASARTFARLSRLRARETPAVRSAWPRPTTSRLSAPATKRRDGSSSQRASRPGVASPGTPRGKRVPPGVRAATRPVQPSALGSPPPAPSASPTTQLRRSTCSVIAASLVVLPGQPRGEPFHRRLELGVEVDERAKPLGEPGQAHLVLAAAGLELLDAPVGEVHQRANACSTSVACSAWCFLLEPVAGEADAGRLTSRSPRPPRCSGRASPRNGHAPWFAGSSCTHTTSVCPKGDL